MSRFFIHRPIFAWVMAIIVMLAGVMAILNLPIAQYPKIAPPEVSISSNYPGASAETVENAVTQVVERQMKGIDGLMYITSTSSSNGQSSITLTFESGTDPDIDQVQVQNKLQAATSRLPEEVQRQGITVNKSTGGFLVVVGFISTDNSMDRSDISDYINTNLLDPMSRVEGVGDIQVFGSPYAMRIWLDPEKLVSYSLMPSDVIAAVRAQNTQVSAGQIGAMPAVTSEQVINATVTVQSRLQTAAEFEEILLKSSLDGANVRLKDVAKVEIGSENYATNSRYNRQQAAGMGISLSSGANALETRTLIEEQINELKDGFPPGLEPIYPYDTTPFVKLSIEEVIKTLAEAILLVFLVMYLFLQNWRATIIPTLAVPVTLLGTFALLLFAGYSINTLTLFAMVLSIGLLVDDAIVVVENTERIIEEEGLGPVEATEKSMDQIGKVVIGIAVVLSAVFIPMAFFGGSTGVIYRQFSITLVATMLLSAFMALTLTPALCASLLVAKDHEKKPHKFFQKFNKLFDKTSQKYQNFVGKSMQKTLRYVVIYAAIIGVMGLLFLRIPGGFLPEEDQGLLFSLIQLPSGATQQETQVVLEKVEDYFLDQESDAVEGVFGITGFSFAGQGQNVGLAFVRLKPWEERSGDGLNAQAVAGRASGYFAQTINRARVFAFPPPAVTELGNASGFNMQLQDTGGIGHQALMNARNQLLGMAAQESKLTRVRPNGQEDSPELKLNVDQPKAAALGVGLGDINQVISTAWGSSYINDFIDRGRVKRVYVQGDAQSRMTPDDIYRWYVRNNQNEMVSFASFSNTEWSYGPPRLTRYNSLPSVNIQGEAAPGVSSGEALNIMENLVSELPRGVGFEWTGLSLEERKSGAQAPILYAISILVIFLCLAALYESWSVPFAVLMVIPLGIIGSLLLTFGRGLTNDIYLQVGLLTIIGLSAKNAILIIEFAKERVDEGKSLFDAVTVAARQRFRPIIMTSLAFGIGVVPLFLSTGAGSGSQNAIGTAVLGGVISATILGVFFIPLFFVWIYRIFNKDESPNTEQGSNG